MKELAAAPIPLQMRYPDGAVAPWDSWMGMATLTLGLPEIGRTEPPAALSLGAGFEELGCVPSLLEGSWTLVGMDLKVTLDDAAMLLIGVVAVVDGRLVGEGSWSITSADCEPDDLAGGSSGEWILNAPLQATMTAPREPRARLLVVGPEGVEVEVTGPVGDILSLVD
jgi:hypothetical protein